MSLDPKPRRSGSRTGGPPLSLQKRCRRSPFTDHLMVIWPVAFSTFASVTFGIKWKQLSPYVHCREMLPLDPYRLGTFTPGLILGIVPGLVGLVTGNAWLLTFGLFLTAGAAGDFYSLMKLMNVDRRYGVVDHPEEAGFILRSRI